MNALEGAIKPVGIHWLNLTSRLLYNGTPMAFEDIVNSSGFDTVGEWPYFLEWLLNFDRLPGYVGNVPLELLVCEFICSNDWGH